VADNQEISKWSGLRLWDFSVMSVVLSAFSGFFDACLAPNFGIRDETQTTPPLLAELILLE